MKQQIVIIGGGNTFDTYKEYISHLKTKDIDLDKFKPRLGWKGNLQAKLGKNFEVLLPHMPNKTNARYLEWKIWFERIVPFLNKDVILIGHSLGGIFLAKYLAENKVSMKIKAVILVAARFDDENGDKSLADFKLPSTFEKFSKQAGEIYLIQSKDDPVVPVAEVYKYKKALPNVKQIILSKGEHFNKETFPQMTKLLKSLRS